MYRPDTLQLAGHIPGSLIPHAEHFINILCQRAIENRSWEEFTNLNSGVLRQTIPQRKIVPVKNELLMGDFVETDGQHIPGEKSQGFRLSPRFWRQKMVRTAAGSPRLSRLRDSVHVALRAGFDDLTLDPRDAERIAADYECPELVVIPAQEIADHTATYHFTVCKYGRVHTSITRMVRPLRSTLRFQGQPLVGLDIASSQPLFLGLVARMAGNLGRIKFSQSNPYIHSQSILNSLSSIMKCISSGDSLYPVDSIASCDETDFAQIQQFIDVCERGELYRFLAPHLTKEQAKKAFFRMLYSANMMRPGRNPKPADLETYRAAVELKKVFTQAFPVMADIVHSLKVDDYSYLACLMQVVESTFIVNVVSRRLIAEGVSLFTVHYSLLTLAKHSDHCRAVLLESADHLGIHPMCHAIAA